ncbi:MAG: MFS transporter [Rubrivivax sp.]|nr:MFS transporter [Rubrivivax sp.]
MPLADRLRLPPGDLWRDPSYLRLWSSILTSSFGNQIMMLALPLTAAVLLKATPTQMGLLTAVELLPFLLFSLPAGVWLDRVRKLPVYVGGELLVAIAAVSVPIAGWLGWLAMPWLYFVGFLLGTVHTVAGSAAQIVLTQVVARERLVEAHAKNALAGSGAEVVGPGLAGLLVKLLGAPVTLLVDALLLVASAAILKGVRVHERRDDAAASSSPTHFWRDLVAGLRFVTRQPLLVTLAVLMGVWQMAHYTALTVQILFATRTLGLAEQEVGLAYMGVGAGTIAASVMGRRISQQVGPGPCLVLGYAVCGGGWLLAAIVPAGPFGIAAFALMMTLFAAGAVLIFINFLALRQAVTPEPLLGRMTSTMRWLTLLAAGPGALLGGWLGEHHGLRSSLLFAALATLTLAAIAWRLPRIRQLRQLPRPDDTAAGTPAETPAAWLGAEADVRPLPQQAPLTDPSEPTR